MTFNDFCIEYTILPNLKKHLLDVAAITYLISNNWIGNETPFLTPEAIKAALLHDVGNMAKSKTSSVSEYLHVSPEELKIWQAKLEQFHQKYGTDDHKVTDMLLNKLNVDTKIREAIQKKSFGNIITNYKGEDWLVKLISYADLRINPEGIVSVQERLDYIKDRYPKYSERVDFNEMCKAALNLEKKIQHLTSLDLNSINEDALDSVIKDRKLELIEI